MQRNFQVVSQRIILMLLQCKDREYFILKIKVSLTSDQDNYSLLSASLALKSSRICFNLAFLSASAFCILRFF